MHPKEAYRQRTGTGRLASLSLIDSEIIVGIDFTRNARLAGLLADPSFYPVVLYPGPDAWRAGDAGFAAELRRCGVGAQFASGRKKLVVLVIDATWFCAKKMLRLSPNLLTFPRLSFSGSYRSQFEFKKQPADGCVSTIESCYYLIRELQSAGIAAPETDPEPLLRVFKKMVSFQIESEIRRIESGTPGRHAYDAERDPRRLRQLRASRPGLTDFTGSAPDQ